MRHDERPVGRGVGCPQGYLRKAAAAAYLGITERTLSQWMTSRVLAFSKVSHRVVPFRVADLDAAVERFRVKAVGER